MNDGGSRRRRRYRRPLEPPSSPGAPQQLGPPEARRVRFWLPDGAPPPADLDAASPFRKLSRRETLTHVGADGLRESDGDRAGRAQSRPRRDLGRKEDGESPISAQFLQHRARQLKLAFSVGVVTAR